MRGPGLGVRGLGQTMDASKLIDPFAHPLTKSISKRTVRAWLKSGRLPGWKRGRRWLTTVKAIEGFIRARNQGRTPRPKTKRFVSLEVLETRAEQCQVEFPGRDPQWWGKVFQHLLPEIFGRGLSRKACNAQHGTSPMRWRLAERARNMLDLEHPRDSNGIPEGNRLPTNTDETDD